MLKSNSCLWSPSREAALEKLSGFVPAAGKAYADKRNYDFGKDQHEAVSGLSPWLRHRVITEQEVIDAVLNVHSERSAEKFIQEVFWRSYWKGWLEMRPQVWQQYQQDLLELYRDEKAFTESQSIVQGGSGIDCFDSWLQELTETGYLHNHARMWFASIWIFTLRLPWQLGADFFLQHLLDGDPASNTLSWRWVAGLQTKGKAYAASAENIAKFTNGRFNPVGQLTANIQPLTERKEFIKYDLPQSSKKIPDGRVGLIVHDDDLQPDFQNQFSEVSSVLALHTSALLSPGGVSEQVAGFTHQCIEAVGAELQESTKPGLTTIFTCTEMQGIQSVVERIVQWAQVESLDAVIWRYAPTGPAASVLNQIESALSANGITSGSIKCEWDAKVWPHAGKGFFALKKKIPEILAAR